MYRVWDVRKWSKRSSELLEGTNDSDQSVLSLNILPSNMNDDAVHILSLEFWDYTITRATVYRDRQTLKACIDTDLPISIVLKHMLKWNYLNIALNPVPKGKLILVSGLGSSVECSFFVHLPLMFKLSMQILVELKAEVHVMNHLPCDLLLRNNILTPNGMGLHTRENRWQFLQLKGQNILISTRKDILLQKLMKNKTSVYLT